MVLMNREQVTGNREPESRPEPILRLGSSISDRLMSFAVAVVELAPKLPRSPLGRHVGAQVVRSGTSAGANYEEARAAESRADFVHKVKVAAKEMRETIFWLKLAHRAKLVPSSFFARSRVTPPRGERARGDADGFRAHSEREALVSDKFPVPCSLFPASLFA